MLTLTSPIETYAHRIPASAKMAAFVMLTVLLFALPKPWLLALPVAALILSCGPKFALQSLKNLRPLIPLILLLAVWHLWLRDPIGITLKRSAAIEARSSSGRGQEAERMSSRFPTAWRPAPSPTSSAAGSH